MMAVGTYSVTERFSLHAVTKNLLLAYNVGESDSGKYTLPSLYFAGKQVDHVFIPVEIVLDRDLIQKRV